MTKVSSETHKLYPGRWGFKDCIMYNDDPFFRYYYPENFQEYQQNGWTCEGMVKEIRGQKIPFVKCPEHPDCWVVATTGPDGDVSFEDCDKQMQFTIDREIERCEIDDPFIDVEILSDKITNQFLDKYYRHIISASINGNIISAKALKRKIENAQPSSPFFHPFVGFEKVDAQVAPMSWTVDDLIPDQSIGAIYGERESLKSFLALNSAMCVASGTSFNGADTRQGSVLYFASEGSTGIGIRREAWKVHNGWENSFIPFYSRGGGFSFTSQADRDYLADLLAYANEFAPRLVIFDTLGQSLGDADENSASDINKIARFLNDLKLAHDCSFLWVDHSGHESKRTRGSSAKGAALDFEYYVKRKGDQIEVTNTKMKDAPRRKPFTMKASPYRGSLILKHVAPNPSHAELLMAIIASESDNSEKNLRTIFYEQTSAVTPEAKQKAFHRSVEKLVNDGKIMKVESERSAKLVLQTSPGHTHPPL